MILEKVRFLREKSAEKVLFSRILLCCLYFRAQFCRMYARKIGGERFFLRKNLLKIQD